VRRIVSRILNKPLIQCFTMSLLLCLWHSTAYADKPYLEQNRLAYIESVLRAFDKAKLQSLRNAQAYIHAVERNNCRSDVTELKVECLLRFAKNNCRELGVDESRVDCELYSDIIIVNKLSEKTFISRSERYRLLKNANEDYRIVMDNRLQQKYAGLVTQFSLSPAAKCKVSDYACMAAALDHFCLDYTNSQSLSWQYCMSATLWFIGTSKLE